MNRRLRIKLVDPTPEKWLKFKGIQNLIATLAAKYNIELSDLVYDEQLYIKSISYKAYSECELLNSAREAATIMFNHDLIVDFLSSEDLSGTRDIIAQLKHSLKLNPLLG